MDLPAYEEATNQKLNCLVENDGLLLPTEVLVDRINSILLDSADDCGPPQRKSKKRKSKYPWSSSLKPIVRKIKDTYYQLKHNPEECTGADLKELKRSLRSQQRQLAAEHRKELMEEISTASTDDRELFYKLVKQQRGGYKAVSSSIDFKVPCLSQLDGWADYFEELATAKSLPHFDEQHHRAMRMKFHSVALQASSTCSQTVPEPINEDTIKKHVKSLKPGKAADVFGMTAEHIKHAAPQITSILTTVANNILNEQKLPDQFKIGAIVPTLKKNKPKKDPDSHRRITMASAIGKIVEKEMMKQTKPHSKIHQDPMQYGFTEECSPSICALMVTEAIAESLDLNLPLYIIFLDSSKAFDMVDHTVLLNALYDLKMDPHLWRLYEDMYHTVMSRVRLNGELSRVIQESRGIRQGGETSTDGFKAKDNKFLNRIRTHPVSLKIGCTPVGIPTVADDNCMLSRSHTAAQVQLLLAQNNASKDRYVFSASKSKVIHIPDRATKTITHKQPLHFNSLNIDYSSKETHLGLSRTPDGTCTQAVKDRIQTGRRTAYQLMGAGLSGMNGISPHTSKTLVNVYVNPALMYGLESLRLEDKEVTLIDNYHRGLLRMLQTLPESTAKPSIYLLLGCLPAQALLHCKMLNLFMTILHRPSTPEFDIITRQLTIKDLSSKSWTVHIRLLLHQYNLPPALALVSNPPAKQQWKRSVKQAVTEYWNTTLKEEASKMKSLKHLNLGMCGIGYTHPVWVTGHDPMQATMATVRAALLVGRYPLTGHKCAGRKQSATCPYCEGDEPETVNHFILRCHLYDDIRSKYLQQLQQDTTIDITTLTENELTCIIIDPSYVAEDEDHAVQLEERARRACFAMHSRRAVSDGRGSMFRWAEKKVRGKGKR